MDKLEAREILRLYRPGTERDEDPQMTAALKLARQDTELGQWLESHGAFYLAMRNKLKEIPVPADLKRNILREDAVRRGRIVELRNAVLPLAAAAAIILLAVGMWSYFTGETTQDFAACRERLVKQSQRGYAMTMTNTNLEAIHSFLLAKHCPDYVLTKPLARLPGEGCTTLEWHDRKVSMVCLKADGNKELFLFVMDGAKLRHTPAAGAAEYSQVHRLMTASWTEGDKIYILAGPGSEAELKQYLN